MLICIEYLPLGTGAGELGGPTIPVGFNPVVYVETTAFLDGHLEGIDDKFDGIVNTGILVRTGVVDPTGVHTPTYRGEIYVDTVTSLLYMANGLTSADWQLLGSSSLALNDLTDVTAPTPVDGDILG